jgi:GTPase SAR1 family protein
MKSIYLLRGLPGSGKSTLAEQLGGSHFETDKYFVDEHGNYNFDGSKLKIAHQWCQDSVSNAMILNGTTMIMIKLWSPTHLPKNGKCNTYFELAKKLGYTVFSIIVENRHGGVNQHGVPEEKLQQMADRFEFKLK